MNENIIGLRVAAIVIDMVLWGVVFVGFSAAAGQLDTSNGFNAQLNGAPFGIYSLLLLAYFIILESQFGGTIGKLILGITVVNNEGSRLSLGQSFIRNILRIVDAFPFIIPYLVGFVAATSSPTKQRIGDRAAQTYVVKP